MTSINGRTHILCGCGRVRAGAKTNVQVESGRAVSVGQHSYTLAAMGSPGFFLAAARDWIEVGAFLR